MANVSHSFGFRPSRYLSSAAYNGQSQIYGFSASQANDAYKGDVVRFDATNRSTPLTDPYVPGIQYVLPAVAAMTTTNVRGIIVGFVPQPDFSQVATASLGLMYRQASTARYVWVVDDPTVIFEVEETGNSYTSTTSNNLNKTVDIAYTAGNQTTGISGVKLATAGQTAAIRPFRTVRYTQRPDNFNFTASDTNSFAHFDVLIANSDWNQAIPTFFGA